MSRKQLPDPWMIAAVLAGFVTVFMGFFIAVVMLGG